MSRYRAVIFDLDGTLVDSAPALQAIAARVLGELGVAPLSIEEARGFIGDGARRFCERALAARGITTDAGGFEALYDRFREIYAAAPGEENPPYDGALETLTALTRAGLPLGLCTNKPELPTRKVLSALGLDGAFGSVVTGDTLATRKPDPAALLHVVEALGATPETALFVGDSEVDAETARAAGVAFALHTAGYFRTDPASFGPAHAFADWRALRSAILGEDAAPSTETAAAAGRIG